MPRIFITEATVLWPADADAGNFLDVSVLDVLPPGAPFRGQMADVGLRENFTLADVELVRERADAEGYYWINHLLGVPERLKGSQFLRAIGASSWF